MGTRRAAPCRLLALQRHLLTPSCFLRLHFTRQRYALHTVVSEHRIGAVVSEVAMRVPLQCLCSGSLDSNQTSESVGQLPTFGQQPHWAETAAALPSYHARTVAAGALPFIPAAARLVAGAAAALGAGQCKGQRLVAQRLRPACAACAAAAAALSEGDLLAGLGAAETVWTQHMLRPQLGAQQARQPHACTGGSSRAGWVGRQSVHGTGGLQGSCRQDLNDKGRCACCLSASQSAACSVRTLLLLPTTQAHLHPARTRPRLPPGWHGPPGSCTAQWRRARRPGQSGLQRKGAERGWIGSCSCKRAWEGGVVQRKAAGRHNRPLWLHGQLP